MGRRTKLTPETQEKIITAIRAGNYANVAAQYAGIHESTFYDWIVRGEAAKGGIYAEFAEAVKKAEADAEARHVLNITNASKKEWTASAWYLERKHSDRWGRKERREITGPGGKPVELSLVERIHNELKNPPQAGSDGTGAAIGDSAGGVGLAAAPDATGLVPEQQPD